MRAAFAAFFILLTGILAATAADDLVTLESPHSAAVTADRLEAAAQAAGATVFARIDHAGGAASIGATLEPTILVIFGNPKIGTPVLQADRRAGLDLPIRVLIWEEGGATKLAYLDGAGLGARHGIEGADEALQAISGALQKLTGAAVAAE
jgi:uncharacterized protein (DUF302 family)